MKKKQYSILRDEEPGYLTVTPNKTVRIKTDKGLFEFNITDISGISRWTYSDDDTVEYDGFKGGLFICTTNCGDYYLAVDDPDELISNLEDKTDLT